MKRPSGEGDLPSLALLEQFSHRSLQQWLASARKLNELQSALFFGLELARQQFSRELIEALRTNLVPGQAFDGWARIVDYRYCLAPLSVAGSLKGNGGRFNIGGSLNLAVFPPFPALYIAEDYPTAFRERFGSDADVKSHGLTGAELALRAPASFTHIALRGQLELVMDLSELRSLQPFATVLRKFSLPDHIADCHASSECALRRSSCAPLEPCNDNFSCPIGVCSRRNSTCRPILRCSVGLPPRLARTASSIRQRVMRGSNVSRCSRRTGSPAPHMSRSEMERPLVHG